MARPLQESRKPRKGTTGVESFSATPEFRERLLAAAKRSRKTKTAFIIEAIEQKIKRQDFEETMENEMLKKEAVDAVGRTEHKTPGTPDRVRAKGPRRN